MTRESELIMRADKCAGIINGICEIYGVSVREALALFYESDMADFIEEGVSDLHCRSPKYLATLIWEDCGKGSASASVL